jgi:hypothetical protein
MTNQMPIDEMLFQEASNICDEIITLNVTSQSAYMRTFDLLCSIYSLKDESYSIAKIKEKIKDFLETEKKVAEKFANRHKILEMESVSISSKKVDQIIEQIEIMDEMDQEILNKWKKITGYESLPEMDQEILNTIYYVYGSNKGANLTKEIKNKLKYRLQLFVIEERIAKYEKLNMAA